VDDPQHSDPAEDCPLPEWEAWACALSVERQFGASAYAHVAERVGTLAKAGDWKGVATWKAIAARLDRLHADDTLQ
jgi:hypothetical protein